MRWKKKEKQIAQGMGGENVHMKNIQRIGNRLCHAFSSSQWIMGSCLVSDLESKTHTENQPG